MAEVAAIATAVTSIIGLVVYFMRKGKLKRMEDYAVSESFLQAKIANAQTNEERMKYAQELDALRNSRK